MCIVRHRRRANARGAPDARPPLDKEKAMGSIGPLEIGIFLLVVVILFGGARIAKLGKSFGESIKGFREAVKDDGKDG
jgi:sec-independent protein translocase protein TatA